LLRLFWPAAILTEERGTFKRFAKKSMQAWLAFPATGGAVSETFSAYPTSPVMALFLARGWTLMAKVAPAGVLWMGITGRSVPVGKAHKKKKY